MTTAQFPPRSRPHTQISSISPLISSILQRSFPLFVMANSVADLVCWTGEDPAMIAFYWLVVYVAVYYYNSVVYWLYLGPLVVFSYCCVNYYVNSVYVDVNTQEKPTLEEILDTLDNLSAKLDLMVTPLRRFQLTWWKLFNYLLIVSPLHILMMRYAISIRLYILLLLVVSSTYHSTWFQGTVRIIWRSQFTRNCWNFFLGSHTMNNTNNYRILKGDRHGKIIQFQILEHQRRWFGVGWSDKLLPYERANFTNEAFQATSSPEEFQFPFNSKHWRWLEESWKVELDGKGPDGWVYCDNYWLVPQTSDSIVSYTRTRKWTRKAVLVTREQED